MNRGHKNIAKSITLFGNFLIFFIKVDIMFGVFKLLFL